jgi:hypothetical protein
MCFLVLIKLIIKLWLLIFSTIKGIKEHKSLWSFFNNEWYKNPFLIFSFIVIILHFNKLFHICTI